MQPQAFNPDSYKIEPSVEFKTEKGVVTEKTCPITNFIRHKFVDYKGSEKDAES